jgi:2-(1,2-epoxy-1,2-dihydrophenyl)acetyl-CoA isomerase
MRRLGKPVVASVQGGVAGAAIGLVAACDLVVAAEMPSSSSRTCFMAANDGLTTYFLPRQIRIRKTLELALLVSGSAPGSAGAGPR